MNEQQQSLQELQHIKKMMERSSRFISLSGLSGVAAGLAALIGAWLAYPYVFGLKNNIINDSAVIILAMAEDYRIILYTYLFWIAAGTFMVALLGAFFFTWLKSRKEGIPIWGVTARRLMVNVSIPLLVGAVFLFRLVQFQVYGLIAPGCLLFYGLALINASKYTLVEIRYLGYAQLLLGIINLWYLGYGLYFWAAGFGVLHIMYGVYMWWKYERNSK